MKAGNGHAEEGAQEPRPHYVYVDEAAQLRQLMALLIELQKASGADNAVRAYANITIDMGRFTLETIKGAAESQVALLREIEGLFRIILELKHKFTEQAVRIEKIRADERISKEAINGAKDVLNEIITKFDPEVVSEVLRGWMKRQQAEAGATPQAGASVTPEAGATST